MEASVVLRWLVPAALAALLAIPAQTAGARSMGGGGGGHGMGGMHMGGMGRGGFGGRGMAMRGRPAMSSRFFSSNGMNHFANRQNFASRNHDFGRFNNHDRFVDRRDRSLDRRDQFRDSHGLADRGVDRADRAVDRADRFRDNHFNEERFEHHFGEERFEHNFFFRHNFFVGFNFGAFGWWPGWWWGGPWWWGWDGWAYPYPDCGYGGGYGTACDDPPATDSRYGSQEYWNDVATSVQSKLAEQSYYHGAVDGVISSDTLQAIRQFQADHGLTVSGKIDPKLLETLGIEYNKQNEQQSAGTNKS
jgi:hypothetical protein